MALPKLLDLFCCQGGAGEGYRRAGFDVTGVDIEPQPRNPHPFIQADALAYVAEHGHEYDAVHASPPCQMFTAYRRVRPEKGDEHYVNLIPATRAALVELGLPYVIENVVGAPLLNPTMLCGSGFGLDVQRHRLFESNVPLMSPGCAHGRHAANRFPGGRSKERTGSSAGLVRSTVEIGTWDIPLDVQAAAMGIGWMDVGGLSQAIPPAYTEHIGGYLMVALATNAREDVAA